eukprot:gene4695-14899_t
MLEAIEQGHESMVDAVAVQYGVDESLAIEQGHESMVDLLLEDWLGVVTAVEVFFVLNSISANDLSKTTMYLRASAKPTLLGYDRTACTWHAA